MESKHFGLGIVGTGMISHFHAKAIAEIKNASLIGVYGSNKNKSGALARKHNCIAFDTLDEMVSSPE